MSLLMSVTQKRIVMNKNVKEFKIEVHNMIEINELNEYFMTD